MPVNFAALWISFSSILIVVLIETSSQYAQLYAEVCIENILLSMALKGGITVALKFTRALCQDDRFCIGNIMISENFRLLSGKCLHREKSKG